MIPAFNEHFYKNGFELIDFNPLDLTSILNDIRLGKVKENFILDSKYPYSCDLRPSVIDYSDNFLSVLKVNQIRSIIRSRTFRDLSLYHVQIRVVESSTSYMDWHRDTYFDAGKKIGMTPPGLKLIFYPECDDFVENRLIIAQGSHRTMLDNRQDDLKLLNLFPKIQISSCNNKALLFDTSLLHAAIPDLPGRRSIRLIYSFVAKEQIPNDSLSLHNKTSAMYEAMF